MLSLPLAFILSQDQTLHRILLSPDKSGLFVYLTEVSSGFFKSFDSITLYYLSRLSDETAVNSICLGTCSSCFKLNLISVSRLVHTT